MSIPVATARRLRRRARRIFLCTAMLLACTCHNASSRAAEGDARFDVWEYQISGNTRLDVERIERAVYAYLGERKTIGDVEQARAALEKAYRDAGYATAIVAIPEQSVASGVVQLEVTEGRVERLRVTGARYYDQGRLLSKLPALAEGEVPNLREVEQQLAAANTTPDRRVQPLLRPGYQPGTTEVELKVEDRLPLHATVEFNNRYGVSRAPDPAKYRLSGTLRYDNLWQREHSISMSYLTSPDNTSETEVGSVAYTVPLGKPGETLTLYAVRSNSTSDLTTTLAGTSVLGKSRILGLRLVEPLRSVADITHNVQWGLDYKDVREDLQAVGSAFATPLTYWLGTVQYAGVRPDTDGETSFGAGIAFTLRGLRNNESQFFEKRFKGESNLFVLRMNAQRTEQLPAKFALTGRVDGQLANVPLPSSEALAAGGVDSVRGYPEGVQIGDQGVRGSLEARTPNLWPVLRKDGDAADFRLLAFYDAAYLRVSKPLPQQISRYTLAGAGIGLRLATRYGLGFAVDVAWRLKEGRAIDTHGTLDEGGTRVHFSINYLL